MKTKEMATAFQNLAYEVGTSSDEMAQEIADYVNRVTKSYDTNCASATISLIPPDNRLLVADGTCYTSIETSYYRPRRLKCVYCDCISSKESGTCEHCGAPLIEEEY